MLPQNSTLSARSRPNITIKPARRPQRSPDPSDDHRPSSSKPSQAASSSRQTHSISPCPPDQIPDFPPPDVILHKDDAGSKVFLAIARSLLSVDNRATTVKDLADLAVVNGLGSQNFSAATQAITTYLRSHNDRCEADQDQPLLLSHSLSGTDADDDLIPALYSLQGGNPRKVSPTRRTNFRKNTAVWYLSRATGAPCPFARAGIRLCDYATLGAEEPEDRSSSRRRPNEAVELGVKRKRALRSGATKDSSDEEDSDNEVDERPRKKLTILVKPIAANRRKGEVARTTPSDSSDESVAMDSRSDEERCSPSPGLEDEEDDEEEEEEPWSLPPYPRRSISIPCYTPSYDGAYPPYPLFHDSLNPFRRSPSLANSVGSLPPDSEDDDDFHISMTHTQDYSDDAPTDFESESEDAETQFESPGPRSPSAPLLPHHAQVTVKEEPRDLQSMLDAWDDFDSTLSDFRVSEAVDPISKPEVGKVWTSDSGEQWADSPQIKQEELSFDSLFPNPSLVSPPSPPSTNTSDGSSLDLPQSLQDEEWELPGGSYATIRPRSKTEPSLPSFQAPASTVSSSLSAPTPIRDDSPVGTNTESTQPQLYSTSSTNLTHSIASLIQSMNSYCPSGVSPSSLILAPTNRLSSDVVVVHTCQPCNPPITATQIEDISVYQMVLGNFHFLRRIDTDFVNLSSFVPYLQAPCPVLSTVPNATIVNKGSSAVVGIWVPLAVAQVYLRDHPAKNGEFDIFLSNELVERFPTALQDFHRDNESARTLNQFGRHFGSTLQITQTQQQHQQVLSIMSAAEMLARQQEAADAHQVVAIPSTTADAYALPASMAVVERQQQEVMEVPLSACEREIFDLCVIPDWDRDSAPPTAAISNASTEDDTMEKEVSGEDQEEDTECTGGDEDGGDVSDASSLTSLESISSSPKPPSSRNGASCKGGPAPPQSSTSSSSCEVDEAPDHPGPTPMEGVVDVQGCPSRTPGPSRVSSIRASRLSNPPLRRSKRFADKDSSPSHPAPAPSVASDARKRTRSGRGGRNSLS